MLKLDRLELSGFKSFVDPVRLEFAGGMTGIVGPNGCGKSNIADAMVWVMGERSAKMLRGQTMEDVIFAGSAGRKPLGMAEVSLTLATEVESEMAPDGRLTIGRRLFRSGESLYLLNGRRVRLKEIRDLLMDTGLGVRAYSVIEQGRIGMILSGKPQERRRLLEEAAGITHYRERRRLAEIKLEEASANLARLEDIVAEVERALRSLKRQAGAARRYGERREAFRALQREVLEARWAGLHARLADLRGRIAARVADESERTAELHAEEASLAEGREALDELTRRLTDHHRRSADLAARIEGKQEFLKGSRQRLSEIAERIEAGRETEARRREQLVGLRQALAAASAKEAELLAERDRAASEVSEDERKISQVERLVEDGRERLESLRSRLLASIGDLNGLRNRLHREHVDREKGELRRRHLEEELAAKRRELAEAAAERERGAERLTEIEADAKAKSARHDELSGRRDELLAAADKLTDERDSLTTELGELERRREILSELGRAHRERREAIRQAVSEAGVAGAEFLSDKMRIPAGWERSLDLYFGELADAVLVPSELDELAIAESLAGSAVTARLLRAGAAGGERAALRDAAIQGSLADLLGLPAALADALPAAYLVTTAADAVRLARRHPGVAFLTRGSLWAQGGALHVQGAAARPGILARGHELAEVREQIPPLERRIAELVRALEENSAESAGLRQALDRAERELAGVREELAVARARQEDLVTRHRRLEVEADTLATESAEVARELELAVERDNRLEQELARAQALHAELETAFDGAESAMEASRQEREAARTSGASRRGRLELLEERLESHRQESGRLEREIAEGERQIELWTAEAGRLGTRETEIRAAMAAAERELQSALEERDATHQELSGEQETVDARRRELKALEERIERRRDDRDLLREAIGELKVEAAAVAQDGEHLGADYRQEFDAELPETPGEPPEELGAREEELERLRDLLERMGPVNLLAADEYDEQEERHRFLTEQRADVQGSVDRLRRTIREINQTSSERFRTAFEEVNRNFTEVFTDLFRGGTAEMRLLDEDDLLESGIEIVARPPGKRLQNIMLMSGGEKALTAIALLFALFRTKPSPFCILDEVDAPLDDVNTLRFVEMIKKMARDTQFILITHNKITMEAASTLYGVTMQERGVSSLVGVELDEVQPEPLAASA